MGMLPTRRRKNSVIPIGVLSFLECHRVRRGSSRLSRAKARALRVGFVPGQRSNVSQMVADHSAVLSAAALKKRLLEKQTAPKAASASASASGPASLDSNGMTNTPQDSDEASGGNAGKRDKVSGAFERLLLEGAEIPAGGDGYVQCLAPHANGKDIDCKQSLQTPEPIDEPPKRKVVQLSSFKPTKDNFQVKANGTAILNFPTAEVMTVLKSQFSPASSPLF